MADPNRDYQFEDSRRCHGDEKNAHCFANMKQEWMNWVKLSHIHILDVELMGNIRTSSIEFGRCFCIASSTSRLSLQRLSCQSLKSALEQACGLSKLSKPVHQPKSLVSFCQLFSQNPWYLRNASRGRLETLLIRDHYMGLNDWPTHFLDGFNSLEPGGWVYSHDALCR